MPSLLRRVKTRLSIPAHRKVRGLLEGEYTSIFHGRSIEFDDLRHYVPGDELKDIDWKATARIGSPMTRRYIASRKHTVMIVADTGRGMAALAQSGEVKSDIGIVAAGVIGYLASTHGDLVGLAAGDDATTEYRRPESTEASLERILELIAAKTSLDAAASDLTTQLRYISRSFRRRMILLIIADDRQLADDEISLLRRLAVQHEILWVSVADADPTQAGWTDRGMFDVADNFEVPSFVRGSRALRAAFAANTLQTVERARGIFDSLAISSTRVESEADVIPSLLRLLQMHRHARR